MDLLRDVYLYLAHQLANVSILTGDDTPTKVVEVDDERRQEANGINPLKINEDENKKLNVSGVLIKNLDDALGWKAPKKNGEGPKRTLQVSFVMGRTIPKSVIYIEQK